MKYFSSRDILQAYHEATAYSVLKPLQGHVIPFCYGVYDPVDDGGVVLLLEELCGTTLLETLTNLSADVGHEHLQEVLQGDDNRFKKVFRECWDSLQELHKSEYAHRDVKGDNIILLKNGQAIFVDLENMRLDTPSARFIQWLTIERRPISRISKKLDASALRLTFAQFGLQESLLRSWCY
jgi:serine/threonine protein kinase